jgi:hypothetical protein
LLENALTKITGEKKSVRSARPQGSKEPDMSDANILRLVHHGKVEHDLLRG